MCCHPSMKNEDTYYCRIKYISSLSPLISKIFKADGRGKQSFICCMFSSCVFVETLGFSPGKGKKIMKANNNILIWCSTSTTLTVPNPFLTRLLTLISSNGLHNLISFMQGRIIWI